MRRRINVLRETGYDTDDSDQISELRNRLNRLNDSDNYTIDYLMDVYFDNPNILTQRQREMVENYISILEEQPTEYIPSFQPDAESDESDISW